ncbi:blastopia polyprotein [Trichonephila clavipes]|nr:blastopia polyprotein [Trichonephila clavipes]
MYLDDIMIPATDKKEAYKKLARVLETDENIRDIKKLLPSSKTECILNNNVLFKISGKQELLVVPEMMQANVIKKVHSFRHFAVTKTGELVRRDYCFPNMRKCVENVIKDCVECRLANKKMQEENGRTYHRKRKEKKLNIRKRVVNNREDSVWKQDEAMDFALIREEERTCFKYVCFCILIFVLFLFF